MAGRGHQAVFIDVLEHHPHRAIPALRQVHPGHNCPPSLTWTANPARDGGEDLGAKPNTPDEAVRLIEAGVRELATEYVTRGRGGSATIPVPR